jgi:hypothetical protein
MPLPLIIGAAAAVAIGAKSAKELISNKKTSKIKEANDLIESSNRIHKKNIRKLEEKNKITLEKIEKLEKKELLIMESFEKFSNLFKKIKNKPEFVAYSREEIKIPKFNFQELEQSSMGIGGKLLLGGAVISLGAVGALIHFLAGEILLDKADDAWYEMKKAEKEINKICLYLDDLGDTSDKFYNALCSINGIYNTHLNFLNRTVNTLNKTNWNDFTQLERDRTENTVLIVSVLYNMLKTKLVLKSNNEKELNKINKKEVDKVISDSKNALNGRLI